MAKAQEQVLGIFADAVLQLALHLKDQAFETDDLDHKAKLAGAMHRLGRGFRQTVALQAKIARDARRDARDVALRDAEIAPAPEGAAPDTAPTDPKAVAVRRRRDWLTRGVERCVWNEYEPDDEAAEFTGDSLLEDFGERLADLMADPDAFLALDPDDLLVTLCRELGLTPPAFHPSAPPTPGIAPTPNTS